MIPYGHQRIDADDEQAVLDVLRSDWLTTGPKVDEFEQAICAFTDAKHGVAVSSGTAALHAAFHALGIGPGDEVVVPAMTFAATANAVLYCGGTPVFCDVLADNLLIDPERAEALITPRTKALVGVDYAGHPCDWDALRRIADKHSLALVADACHALGGKYHGRKVGTLADISVFSFHPVKHLTTGEGGMCVTDDAGLALKMRRFRNHGISTDARQREKAGGWYYEMTELGFNYRITDIQCALGISQLNKMPRSLEVRNAVARQYEQSFQGTGIAPLARDEDVLHAYHLFVVRVRERDKSFSALRQAGIGVNVHYIPVHLHPYYRERLGTKDGMCPVSEAAYREILSLPMWCGVEEHMEYICAEMKKVCGA
ncbi:UDP-4-amino-4,6-dideoxy-N-acetyl-beta-L-altrosamine transaminase [Paucidesulfovibrio longus]|uniref:UDP-4-amino-4, 6-dideoxy-N-acetyl-beta-L-altrosamine transaminase n=1 Tax=Paucidesulfovibrio longus TaxID=889 RepID=UPI0003B3247B|nr:UDP-4-amino-4,6-dideoxy-N-acetyl-beta-L-altrosamine transaminase [Paucidesulfovibrio longus]